MCGVPCKLPDGTTRASISELAREIGCTPAALRYHVIDHRGGYAWLGSLPDPTNVGHAGGGVHKGPNA